MPIADIERSTEQATALLRAAVVGAVGSTEILLAELSRAEGWQVPLVVTLPPNCMAAILTLWIWRRTPLRRERNCFMWRARTMLQHCRP
ncbi:hypothetical protein ACFSHP_22860 [Novosphingobium panipatense]